MITVIIIMMIMSQDLVMLCTSQYGQMRTLTVKLRIQYAIEYNTHPNVRFLSQCKKSVDLCIIRWYVTSRLNSSAVPQVLPGPLPPRPSPASSSRCSATTVKSQPRYLTLLPPISTFRRRRSCSEAVSFSTIVSV